MQSLFLLSLIAFDILTKTVKCFLHLVIKDVYYYFMQFIKNKVKKFGKLHILFFFNSKKNRHVQIGFFSVLLIITLIFLIALYILISILSYSALKAENHKKTVYINDLKMQIIDNHISSHFKKEAHDLDTEEPILKKNHGEEEVKKSTEVKFEKPVLEEESPGKIKVSFSIISNDEKEKKVFSGRVCVLIEGVNADSKDFKLSFPDNIILPSEGSTLRCEQGLFVKFSRLRPTNLYINSGKFLLKNLTFKKVTLIFHNTLENTVSLEEFTDF
ncbi:MAG: hypothetical protein K2X39_08760 [Silvanigrellaceae bacterium]|nr:hypothetical protein [Silvanigrellaceae bacterium]